MDLFDKFYRSLISSELKDMGLYPFFLLLFSYGFNLKLLRAKTALMLSIFMTGYQD